ncbi:MAG: P-loop NTPase, partial [Deltaproteobacteria bacterium]|nr:P-loop NTPase [Deltaproteobacteria bacterium]
MAAAMAEHPQPPSEATGPGEEGVAGDLDAAPTVITAAPLPRGRVLAVSGAKGGVGKSIVAANLAIYLASLGRRVILVDADSEGASLHTVLGVSRPAPSARQALGWGAEGAGRPAEGGGPVLVETAIPSLSLLHGGIDEPV